MMAMPIAAEAMVPPRRNATDFGVSDTLPPSPAPARLRGHSPRAARRLPRPRGCFAGGEIPDRHRRAHHRDGSVPRNASGNENGQRRPIRGAPTASRCWGCPPNWHARARRLRAWPLMSGDHPSKTIFPPVASCSMKPSTGSKSPSQGFVRSTRVVCSKPASQRALMPSPVKSMSFV